MANVDFRRLVNDAADRFEVKHQMAISPSARDELIQPALPYTDHVERELMAGRITRAFLEESIYTVLTNAKDIASNWGRTAIGEDTVRESMKRYCPYLFWC